MKRTVFFDAHVSMGGKIVPFAGYEMPVEFSGVKNEHNLVRKHVGVFDVSHMGEIRVTGERAGEFVQKVTSNDIQSLEPGKIQYSCFPNGKGGIVDDLLVYQFDRNDYLLVVNAANVKKDHEWLLANAISGAEIINESDQVCQLAIQGPAAIKVLQKITEVDLGEVPYYHFVEGRMGSAENVLISNTGYTGAGGFELYTDNSSGPGLLEAVMEAGKEYNIAPAGLAARDTLRLEMGFCLYGNDIDESTSPLEAGLGWITKFVEGNDFIDRPFLERQKKEGIARRLSGFELQERGIARSGYPIFSMDEQQIGAVTSGTMSPFTGKSIGMGYINVPFHKKETEILIGVRNKKLKAVVKRPPFIEK